MSAPPDHIIEHAIIEAKRSPCAKSKRGAVVFNGMSVISMGHNAQPTRTGPFDICAPSYERRPPQCDGSDACRASCSKACIHAEEMAIISSPTTGSSRYLELVHVKIVNGELVAGGKPSCWQCSRLCLAAGIGVWLYEANRTWYERPCDEPTCGYVHVYGDHSPDGDGDRERCPNCGLELSPISRTIHSTDGTWRLYSPQAFHEATAANCGIHLP